MKKIVCLVLPLLLATSPLFALDVRNVDIHGFLSRGLLKSTHFNFVPDSKQGSLAFGEVGINFGSGLTDDLRIGIQFLAREFGDLGHNDMELDWAVADYRWSPLLGIRVGRLKMPMALYNETRDLDMLRTSILLPQGVYPETWRDTMQSIDGAGLYGILPMGSVGNLNYELQTGLMTMKPDGGMARSIMDSLPIVIEDINRRESYLARIGWQTPLEGLCIGGSMMASSRFELSGKINNAPMTIAFRDIRLLFGSAEYIRGDLTLAGEFTAIESKSEILPKKSMSCQGYYLKASYRFWDWMEAGVYYSVFYRDKDDKDGLFFTTTTPWPNAALLPQEYRMQPDFLSWSKDLTLSLRFDFNEFWLFKLESHFMNGAFGIPIGENLPDPGNPGKELKEDWVLLAAKVTYNF